jgi:PAS domain-containing protein
MGQTKTGELKRARRRDRASTAARLGVRPLAVRERGIKPGKVGGLLAARPGWLIAERRQAQTAREAEDRLRRELADALVTSVQEVWFQDRKHAVTGADAAAIDARWAPEVRRAKREARQLAGELTPEQVPARIGRERDASFEAACDRAGRLLRALEG